MFLKILVAFACILIITMPFASATQVNILFNGVVQKTASISPQNVVNRQISVVHDPADITWSKVKVVVTINSASLAHTVEKIFLFKCKLLSPVACSSITPVSFEAFADTELLWKDISQQEGAGTYPQTANLMTLVKLRDGSGQVSWVGFWDKITRTEFNVFTKFNFELSEVDFHAKSFDFIAPIVSFITNFQILPFNWASKVSFKTSPLYAVGGDAVDIDVPILTSASPPGDTITTINKDFFLVSSQTTSGITSFITLNQNPSFTCGDNVCDLNLGESSSTCCFDCGCQEGDFCDVPDVSDPEKGVCKSEGEIALTVLDPSLPTINDCTKPIAFDLRARIENAPTSLPKSISSTVVLNATPQKVTCTGEGNLYSCPVQIQPTVSCGAGSFMVGPNAMDTAITFNDGKNPKTISLSKNFSDFQVRFNCGCPEGFFCDATRLSCNPLGSLSLTIVNVTSFLQNFNPAGDSITVVAKINNPPSDLAVTGVTYNLGTLYKDSSPILNQTTGSVTCSGGPPSHLYTCIIPVSISGYSHTFAYFFKGNKITFSVAFSNVDESVTREITSGFADITIPSFQCGDGVCNTEESQINCCVDCGCPQGGMYCDNTKQFCSAVGNISLSIVSVDPLQLLDCTPKVPHKVEITAQVNNPPSDVNLDFVFYTQAGEVKPYPLQCKKVNPGANAGLFSCELTLPSLPECESQKEDYLLGPNGLNFSVSFADGKKGLISKTLQKSFPDIAITPIYECGNAVCETLLGETSSNCCVDCSCEIERGSDFFCDVKEKGDPGICIAKQDIRLVIDSPTAPVSFNSCEKPQKLLIKAHIENEPSNLLASIFTGVLNGTNADLLACRKVQSLFTEGNVSAPIECQLTIPSIPKCSVGQTYVYDPNSLAVGLAFQSGQGTTKVATVQSSLPKIITTQQIRSIFDITMEAFQEITREVEETVHIVEKLLDQLNTCVKVALVLAIVSIAGIIAGGIVGGQSEKGTWAEGVTAGAQVGTAMMNMWQKYCELISLYYNTLIVAQKMQISLKQMQFCVDIVQHNIDLGDEGPCKAGQELSCFNQLVSCLNFGNIDSAIGQLTGLMRQSSNVVGELGKSIEDFGQGLAKFDFLAGGSASGTLSIQKNNGPLQNGIEACNRRAGKKTTPAPWLGGSSCQPDDTDNLNIRVIRGTGCEFPVVLVDNSLLCSGNECANKIYNIDEIGTTTKNTYTLYCFRDPEAYVKHSSNLGDYKNSGQQDVIILADTKGINPKDGKPVDGFDCVCGTEDGAGSSPGGGAGGGTLNLKVSDAALVNSETIHYIIVNEGNAPSPPISLVVKGDPSKISGGTLTTHDIGAVGTGANNKVEGDTPNFKTNLQTYMTNGGTSITFVVNDQCTTDIALASSDKTKILESNCNDNKKEFTL